MGISRMNRTKLVYFSLIFIGLSGCASYETQESALGAQADEMSGKGRDWLTAWKNEEQDSSPHHPRRLGFSRWPSKSNSLDYQDNLTNQDEADLWQEVRATLTLPDRDHPRVQKEALWYARNHRFMDRVSEQAEPYFHFVLGELQRRNMPVELALLPVVESAYEPRATSSQNAAGLWQLVPGTARRWGLELNSLYDGRRDVFASTHAALDYLEKLKTDFNGDWLLAMAAYNCGALNVERAVQKNAAMGRPTDFWSLDLPNETRTFVPRILGLAALVDQPANYGVSLRTLRDMPVTPVKVGYQVDLAKVAKIAEVPLDQVKRLNPGYHHGKTDADGGHLLLPVVQARAFQERLALLDPQELSPLITVAQTDAGDEGILERTTKGHRHLLLAKGQRCTKGGKKCAHRQGSASSKKHGGHGSYAKGRDNHTRSKAARSSTKPLAIAAKTRHRS